VLPILPQAARRPFKSGPQVPIRRAALNVPTARDRFQESTDANVGSVNLTKCARYDPSTPTGKRPSDRPIACRGDGYQRFLR